MNVSMIHTRAHTPYACLASSGDVGLVDLNHFSVEATPRYSVKNSSLLFSSSPPLFAHVAQKSEEASTREREREVNASLEVHLAAHF